MALGASKSFGAPGQPADFHATWPEPVQVDVADEKKMKLRIQQNLVPHLHTICQAFSIFKTSTWFSRSLPGFPHGLILHDAALTRSRLKNRSEEALFAEDGALRRCARRGLSFVEAEGGAGVGLVRRGLPKFFDLESSMLEVGETSFW